MTTAERLPEAQDHPDDGVGDKHEAANLSGTVIPERFQSRVIDVPADISVPIGPVGGTTSRVLPSAALPIPVAYGKSQATVILRRLGFRIRTTGEFSQALAVFQGGYNLGGWLRLDGKLGPVTSAALARSEINRLAGRGTASAHFFFTEWACTCRGTYKDCRVLLVRRDLLQSLEKYRVKAGPTTIESGYRCPSRNRAVGGAENSQHMYGCAADVRYKLTDRVVKSLEAFAGIGRSRTSLLVRHVDRRDISGNNNGGTLARPMVWNYSS